VFFEWKYHTGGFLGWETLETALNRRDYVSPTGAMTRLLHDDVTPTAGLQIEGVLAYFTHLKCQKRIGDDVGELKYVFITKKSYFLSENYQPDTFSPTYYARI
jgi:hypothetical protein